MFRKRIKKEFLPGTFIYTPVRVIVIMQLCLVFSVAGWILSKPFMEEFFDLRTKMYLYETVMGTRDLGKNTEDIQVQDSADEMRQNALRFSHLAQFDQEIILKDYVFLQMRLNTPFVEKFIESLKILTLRISSFELAWIFFSLVISIFLLKKIEGATKAVWLIPLLVFMYGVDNHVNTSPKKVPPDIKLFPPESEIISQYVREPFAGTIARQRALLLEGWNTYLIEKWANESRLKETLLVKKQVEKGEFYFNVARLKAIHYSEKPSDKSIFNHRTSPVWMVFYFGWNLFFAWFVFKNYDNGKVRLVHP